MFPIKRTNRKCPRAGEAEVKFTNKNLCLTPGLQNESTAGAVKKKQTGIYGVSTAISPANEDENCK